MIGNGVQITNFIEALVFIYGGKGDKNAEENENWPHTLRE